MKIMQESEFGKMNVHDFFLLPVEFSNNYIFQVVISEVKADKIERRTLTQ